MKTRETTPPTKIDPYYNAIRSPKLTKRYTEKPKDNKPDLIQHYIQDTREYVNLSSVFNDKRNEIKNNINKTKSAEIKTSPPAEDRPESPVYENIDEILSNQPSEKESSIIQELTKAADQILQAVNGYTDDDSIKLSSDDEFDKKNRFRRNSEVLETISESKSWKQTEASKKQEVVRNRTRNYRPTSSTSSLESVTKEYKPVAPVRQNRSEKLKEEKMKKKVNGNSSEISKITRQRRLQRASSREALLQSHGSSSEDLSHNEVVRKPRLVKRNRNQQVSSVTSNEMSKKTTVSQTSYVRKRECEMRRNDR